VPKRSETVKAREKRNRAIWALTKKKKRKQTLALAHPNCTSKKVTCFPLFVSVVDACLFGSQFGLHVRKPQFGPSICGFLGEAALIFPEVETVWMLRSTLTVATPYLSRNRGNVSNLSLKE
jgi:hypothetical protein